MGGGRGTKTWRNIEYYQRVWYAYLEAVLLSKNLLALSRTLLVVQSIGTVVGKEGINWQD